MTNWLYARLDEASTWGGIGAFFLALGTGLTSIGYPETGAIVGVVGGAFGGVVAFIKHEKGSP